MSSTLLLGASAPSSRKQIVRQLNALVEEIENFDPQDWRDMCYPYAVELQLQTKSRKEVCLPEEIWRLIKEYFVGFGGVKSIIPKSKLYKSMLDEDGYVSGNLIELDTVKTIVKDRMFVAETSFGELLVCKTTKNLKVSALSKIPFGRDKEENYIDLIIVGSLKRKAYLPFHDPETYYYPPKAINKFIIEPANDTEKIPGSYLLGTFRGFLPNNCQEIFIVRPQEWNKKGAVFY